MEMIEDNLVRSSKLLMLCCYIGSPLTLLMRGSLAWHVELRKNRVTPHLNPKYRRRHPRRRRPWPVIPSRYVAFVFHHPRAFQNTLFLN